MKNIDVWSSRVRNEKIEIYGHEYLPKYWAQFVEGINNLYGARNGNICTEHLENIKCPTHILHGEKDVVVDYGHALHLYKHIKGSKKYLYPDGKHDIHLTHPEDFKKRVEDFLTK